MKTKTTLKLDPKTTYAAQNARLGLITTADLSLLTGIEPTRLNNFAKQGQMNHYGEYHGKRFFNFQEIVNWLNDPEDQGEAKPVLRAGIKEMLEGENCPYDLEKPIENPDGTQQVRIVWKEFIEE